MDKERRSRLKRVVTEARKVVEEDVRVQLRRLGFDESGKVKPVGELPHLSNEDRELRGKILETIEKEKTGGISDREAFDRYVRHVGFTYVNRIAALRAMEVRGLIKETVVRRDVYGGRSRREYEIAEREGGVDPYRLLKASLVEAFEEISAEIKVLFDVNTEYSLIFLGHKALLELIRLLSEEVPKEDWKEDDIIGWIYQYYNSEARSEFRKKMRKPRPDDIPVINQFYTPRWLVRALVDNTLGRLWLEMKGRIPKPGKAKDPTKERLRKPQGQTVDEYCSYLIPLRQGSPPREKKSIREIKVLDPACGSGHFLVYAFNVLYRMYLEDEPDIPRDKIPKLILENNLFGIDVDLRAVQLAALGLFLKAKEYNRDVKIERMNLVCADVRITDGHLRKEFLSRLESDVDLQRIFAKLFTELEYTYNVGSLLKVRAPFERLLEERRKGVQTKFHPKIIGQSSLSRKGGVEGQSGLWIEGVEKGILVKPAVTLEEMLDVLLEFEREGMEKKDMGAMLFAGEGEKSVGLLFLLSQRYDVVVMNPPYGDMPKSAKDYAKEHYPRTHYDYYAAFIEQAVDLCEDDGFVGMLTGRTFMFLRRFEKVRTEILLKEARSEIVFDLNSSPSDNILDEATGRWAATVARKFSDKNEGCECVFVRLTLFEGEEKKIIALENAVSSWLENGENSIIYPLKLKSLRKLSRMPYSYWTPHQVLQSFQEHPPVDKDNTNRRNAVKIADTATGLQTSDDERFTRYFWEVNPETIAKGREETIRGKKWVPFIRGGNRFYSDINVVVNWKNNGEDVKNFPKSCVRNEDFYFHLGLCWSDVVSSILFDMRILPEGAIFSNTGWSMFPKRRSWNWSLLALLNSSLLAFCFLCLDPTLHHRSTGYISQLPVAREALDDKGLQQLVHEAYDLKREWDSGNEVSTQFIKPWILQTLHHFVPSDRPITRHPLAEQFQWPDWEILRKIRSIQGSPNMPIRQLVELCIQREKMLKKRLCDIQELIDQTVYDAYGIEERTRKFIDEELSILTVFLKGLKKSYEESFKPEISVEEHVTRLVSFYVKKTIELDPDGLVPFHELVQGVRKHVAIDFGEEQADRKEREIEEILGKSLKDWIATDYFDFHINLYKRRPIFWHLTSSSFTRIRGSSGAFNCFLYYNKLDKDTIPKIMMNYLRLEVERAEWKVDRLKRELQEVRGTNDKRKERRLSEELDSALSTLEELQNFQKALEEVRNPRRDKTKLPKNARWVDQKIAEVRDNGYTPIIDYGVRVNIEPLKETGLLHKAARRVK